MCHETLEYRLESTSGGRRVIPDKSRDGRGIQPSTGISELRGPIILADGDSILVEHDLSQRRAINRKTCELTGCDTSTTILAINRGYSRHKLSGSDYDTDRCSQKEQLRQAKAILLFGLHRCQPSSLLRFISLLKDHQEQCLLHFH